MAVGWLPIVLFTLIWGLVGGLAPRYVPLGPNRELLQVKSTLLPLNSLGEGVECCQFN